MRQDMINEVLGPERSWITWSSSPEGHEKKYDKPGSWIPFQVRGVGSIDSKAKTKVTTTTILEDYSSGKDMKDDAAASPNIRAEVIAPEHQQPPILSLHAIHNSISMTVWNAIGVGGLRRSRAYSILSILQSILDPLDQPLPLL